MNYQMLRDVRSGRIHMFSDNCWMLRDWVAKNIGLEENGVALIRRLDLLEMKKILHQNDGQSRIVQRGILASENHA